MYDVGLSCTHLSPIIFRTAGVYLVTVFRTSQLVDGIVSLCYYQNKNSISAKSDKREGQVTRSRLPFNFREKVWSKKVRTATLLCRGFPLLVVGTACHLISLFKIGVRNTINMSRYAIPVIRVFEKASVTNIICFGSACMVEKTN
jgi:hypothetical protein